MNEFERIDAIRRRLELGAHPEAGLTLGIGDDAALLAASPHAQALSVDTAIEGVHFRLDFGSPERLGRRAVMAAASDLAAMGARPRCALSALALPDPFDDDTLLRLVDGFAAAARELDMPIVGGNLSKASELSITTTVAGELEGPALRRSGARPGDVLYLSGDLGSAALGLRVLLERQELASTPPEKSFVDAWLDPRAAIEAGRRLRGHATACVDVSDGFAQDCLHLLRASGVGARVELSRLPRAPGFSSLARELGAAEDELVLAGGEDYVLLFTAPADDPVARGVGVAVGEVRDGDALEILHADGRRVRPPSGFRHGERP